MILMDSHAHNVHPCEDSASVDSRTNKLEHDDMPCTFDELDVDVDKGLDLKGSNGFSSRIRYLTKREKRLHHKLTKLRLCQLSKQASEFVLTANSQQVSESNCRHLYEKSKSILPDYDSDATDSSSDESESELEDTFHPFHSQFSTNDVSKSFGESLRANYTSTVNSSGVKSRTKVAEECITKTSSVSFKWQWLQFQIQSLEFKILQTNDILRRIRTQEPRATFDEVPFVLSQDGTTEETESAARVRGAKNVSRKKLGSTLSVIAQSQGSLLSTGNHCSCPPNSCCIICGGPGVMYVKNPDRSSDSCTERINSLFSKHHRVLSNDSVPLAAQYGRLIKDKKCNSRSSVTKSNESSNVSVGVTKKPVPKDRNSNQLQILLQSKKKSRQARKEAQKRSDVELKLSEADSGQKNVLKKAPALNGTNQIKSATSSRASSPASSASSSRDGAKKQKVDKDKPYMPDLSESSSSDSEGEPKTWNPSPAKIQRIQQQRKEGKKISLNAPESHRDLPREQPAKSSTSSSETSFSGSSAAQLNASSSSASMPSFASNSAKKLSTQVSTSDASDSREDIIIPLSNSLPLFEPVVYKTIETPQWRTKWLEPLPVKNVGSAQIEEMSSDHYGPMHSKYEHEERIKIAGLHQNKSWELQPSFKITDVRKDVGELRPYDKRDFPLTQRQLLDVNKTLVTRNQDFFEVL